MTYREIYRAALRLVSESDGNLANEDYEERAGYILAILCNECAPIEKKYCAAHSVTRTPFTPCAEVTLSAEFPLQDVFINAAIYYLSAMLVADENEELSDRFFELYTDALSAILADLPCTKQRIVNEYPTLI